MHKKSGAGLVGVGWGLGRGGGLLVAGLGVWGGVGYGGCEPSM